MMKDRNDDKTYELVLDTTPIKKKPGRSRIHKDNAAKQKAYRESLKAKGLREIKRMVPDMRDVNQPLRSDIIDLSAVRRSRCRSL